jgi:hypothetical protein
MTVSHSSSKWLVFSSLGTLRMLDPSVEDTRIDLHSRQIEKELFISSPPEG